MYCGWPVFWTINSSVFIYLYMWMQLRHAKEKWPILLKCWWFSFGPAENSIHYGNTVRGWKKDRGNAFVFKFYLKNLKIHTQKSRERGSTHYVLTNEWVRAQQQQRQQQQQQKKTKTHSLLLLCAARCPPAAPRVGNICDVLLSGFSLSVCLSGKLYAWMWLLREGEEWRRMGCTHVSVCVCVCVGGVKGMVDGGGGGQHRRECKFWGHCTCSTGWTHRYGCHVMRVLWPACICDDKLEKRDDFYGSRGWVSQS